MSPRYPAPNQPEDGEMLRCQESIGYLFRREGLLRKSLTHSSVKDDKHPSNERLEFLGDAILGMVISEYLFSMLPENDEGDLTKVKSVVVSSQTLSRLGLEMGLDKYLLLGKGIRLKAEIPRSLIANAVEAVIAAVYLDRGMEAARHFVLDHLHYYVEEVLADEHVEKNYKSLLQQCAQRELSGTPTYRVVAERGPDHSKSFRVAAVIKGHEYPIGSGDSKKAAEQEAARIALVDIEKGKGRPRRGSRRKTERNGSDRNGRDSGGRDSGGRDSGGRDGGSRRSPERSEPRTEARSESKARPKERSRARPKPKSEERSRSKSEDRGRSKSEERGRSKPEAKSRSKSEERGRTKLVDRSRSKAASKPRSKPESRSKARPEPRTREEPETRSRSKAKAKAGSKAKPRRRTKPAEDRAPAREEPKPRPKARVTGSKKAAKKPARKVASKSPAKGKSARVGRNPEAARKPSRSSRSSSSDKSSGRRRGSSRSGNR